MKPRTLAILSLILLSCSINIAAQQERFVTPVDQGVNDSTFRKFRDSLLRTIKTKNTRRLLAIVASDIKLSFGGAEGLRDFRRIWKPSDPKSEVWKELTTILANGGTFYGEGKEKTFCAPYLFTTFPEDLDAFDYHAIFAKNVNLREKPNLSSNVVAKLSYNVVKTSAENSVTSTSDPNHYIWVKIETLGGKSGYVAAQFVRSSIDYRACFAKVNGRWKMTVLIAGD
ncbi:MAG: SH3 domain-containing protein [Pyrinomonadaceae bacterium]|nr:SH3 domain-containing protein [Pyrinomonadaceae bacterium]